MNETILLVEDNQDNRTVYTTILSHFGFNVITAEDGREGVALARTVQPALILMDISLPVMDGWQATEIIKSDPTTATIPVIAVTAHGEPEDRERAGRLGFERYLTKPLTPVALVREVEHCLEERRWRVA